MPNFLINQDGVQSLVELNDDKHITGEILWRDDIHGPLPDGIVVGAMQVEIWKKVIVDETGAEIEMEVSRNLVLNDELRLKIENQANQEISKMIEDAARKYLAATDWYVIRASEVPSKPVPEEVLQQRAQARSKIKSQDVR